MATTSSSKPSSQFARYIAPDYRNELARTLQSLPPAGFERFCQRLLRESGFQDVTLVDGEKLVSMLEQLELGLKPRQTFELDPSFFDEYKK